jgi:hypothetical protein
MASKKQLEERIKRLEEQVRRLENMHATIRPTNSWETISLFSNKYSWKGIQGTYGSRPLTWEELKDRHEHPQPKQVDYSRITNVPKNVVNTDRISRVTFDELARFVLDGTPIERKTKEEVVYQTSYSPNETSEFVETKLGNISVIERND